MKKRVAFIISLLLCLSMTLAFLPVVSADTAAEILPEKTVVVNLSATTETTTVTFADKVYQVTFGTNCFATLGDARDACPAGGTILLCPGVYTGNYAFGKDVTIKGPTAGIDPNVRGAKVDDDWTLNPLRDPTDSTKEAIFKGQIWPGFSNADNILNDDIHMTIDGLVFGEKGFIRSTNFAKAKETVTVKNVIAYQTEGYSLIHTVAGSWAYNADINLCQRYLTFENIRAMGVKCSLFGNVSAESFLATGVYVDDKTDSNAVLSLFVTASAAGTAPVTFTIRDSMFRNRDITNKRAINFNMRNNAYSNFNADIDKKESVTATVDNCVFLNCGVGDGNAILSQYNTNNVFFVYTNNIFKQTGETIADYRAFGDYSNLSEFLPMGANFTIDNNTYINMVFAAKLYYSSDDILLTKNLSMDLEGNVGIPAVWPNDPEGTENPKVYHAKISSYYTDAQKTDLKLTDGTEPVINPEDLKTVVKSVPEDLFKAPTPGKAPSSTANIPSDANYTASSVKWYDANNNQIYTIKPGSTYIAVATLTVGSDMTSFKQGETAIPAGMVAEFGEDGKTVVLKQTFTTEPAESTETTTDPASAEQTTAPEPGSADPAGTTASDEPTTDGTTGKKGCASVAGMGALVIVTLLGSALLRKKF